MFLHPALTAPGNCSSLSKNGPVAEASAVSLNVYSKCNVICIPRWEHSIHHSVFSFLMPVTALQVIVVGLLHFSE